jgi:general nucleoside transport system permease protein
MNNLKSLDRRLKLSSTLTPVIAVVFALAIGAILIAIAGVSPIDAYKALLYYSLGNMNNFGETLVKAVPLMLAGLGMAVAIRTRIFNIGAEGQIYMGALGAAYVGLFMGELPAIIGIPLILIAGSVMGALWSGIAGFLKIKFHVNEIIVTLMMNYIAMEITSYIVGGPWRDPKATEPFTALFAKGAQLPVILPGTRLHAGFIVAIAAALILWWVTRNTVFGLQTKIVGENEEAAKYSGIKTGRMIMLTMLISGGLAGLAGVGEVAGLHHRVMEGFSPGYGYTAIAIALLGRLEPIGVMAAAFLFAALVVGADGMQVSLGVPVSIVLIIEGLVLLFVLGSEEFRKRQILLSMTEQQ